MKQITILICLFFLYTVIGAQVTVNVKGIPKVKSIPAIKGKQDNNTNSTDKGNQEEPKQVSDTASKPVAVPDDSYNGPAKSQLKSFWSHIEKLRNGTGTSSSITNAERMIQMVKEKDPNYNVAALEAEVKPWKEKAAKETNSANDARAKEEEKKNYFKSVWQKMIGVHSTGSDIQPGVTGKIYYDRVMEINLPEYQERKKRTGCN